MGYFPLIADVPEQIITHISRCIRHQPSAGIAHEIPKRTLYRYHRAIREFVGITAFDARVESRLQKEMLEATQTQHSTIDLINSAVEWLLHEGIELPAFDTLRRICGNINSAKHRSIQNEVIAHVPRDVLARLYGLLMPAKGQLLADWARIRERRGAPTLSSLREYLDHDKWV